MYAYLKGIVAQKTADRIVVEVSGVGYNVFVSPGKIYDFPSCGEDVKVYTYTSVREDAISLYGFTTLEELELFKLLISVSGIGPKGGLAILSVMEVNDIKYAIMTGDSKLLAKAPGIGKKTAERMIIDLKDKIDAGAVSEPLAEAVPGKTLKEYPEALDASEALTALGYPLRDAERAVEQAVKELSEKTDIQGIHSDQILKTALKYM